VLGERVEEGGGEHVARHPADGIEMDVHPGSVRRVPVGEVQWSGARG
jgi:hypothetical protein